MSDPLERLRAALADRYTLERELGRGGMATVYLAHDRKLGRPVALKVLRPELAAALGPERFLREIRTTAQLAHPHILPLYDSGMVGWRDDGSTGAREDVSGVATVLPSYRPTVEFLYYTMPFVEGESLRDRLTREKQLPLEDALQVTREVADALGHAHALGIVHRDIKPENILFQAGHALVADFGIAKAVSAAGGARLTETGLAIGTPAYMSPEQAAGSGDVDGRSDLYSLGCVLYEMLSGETPYLGHTPQAILAKKLSEPAPRVSVMRATVPAGVEAALTTVLARTPADRFRTAAAFSEALTREGPSPRVHRRVPRWMLPAAGAAVVVGAAALVVPRLVPRSAVTRLDAPRDPVMVVPFEVRGSEPALVDAGQRLATELTDAIAQEGLGAVAPAAGSAGPSSTPADLRRLARASQAATLVTGTVYQRGDSVEVQARLLRAADLMPVLALPVERGVATELSQALEATKQRVLGAVAYYLSSRMQGRDASLYRPPSSLEVFRLAQSEDFAAAFAMDTTNLGYAVRKAYAEGFSPTGDSILRFLSERRSRLTRGEALQFEHAQALWRSPEEEYRAAMAGYAVDPIGWAQQAMNAAVNDRRPEEALRYYRARDTSAAGPYLAALDELALQALHTLGRFEEQMALARSARPDDPLLQAWFRTAQAMALTAMGRMPELDSIIAISQADEYPVAPGQVMINIGIELQVHGHPEAAGQVFERAADWLDKQRFDGVHEFDRLNVLAWAYYLSGRFADAKRVGDLIALRLEAADHWGAVLMATFDGRVAARLGDTAGTLRVTEALLGERRVQWRRNALNTAGYLYAILGRRERAVALLREAMNSGARVDYTHEWVDLHTLFDYPPFQALVRLKD